MDDDTAKGARGTAQAWRELRSLAHQRLQEGPDNAFDAVALARCVRRTFGEPRLWDWTAVGVTVKRKRLTGSGMLLPDGFPIEVWVNSQENERRQRFTVAHELCHFLLRGAEHLVAPVAMEEFCEAFASELLVPQSQLNALRTASGDLPSAQEIVEVANRFGVNFAPVIVQLHRVRVSRPSFAIVARRGADKSELLIDRSAGAGSIGGPVAGQRLASVGSWGTLFDDSDEVRLDGTAKVASRFLLPARGLSREDQLGSPRSGYVSGKVFWTAFRLRNGRLVVSATFLQVDELRLSSPRNARDLGTNVAEPHS